MAVKDQLKEVICEVVNAVEKVKTSMGFGDDAGSVAKHEMATFMMYLSASDGEIQWSEASMISEVCDMNLTPQTLGNYIREHNIFSTEFESKVPVTLQRAVAIDNKLLEKKHDASSDFPSALVKVYEVIAEILMSTDDDEDHNEKKDCQIYLDMMENYINDNSVRRKTSVSGFTKNTGGVSAPIKSGVSAPKKKG